MKLLMGLVLFGLLAGNALAGYKTTCEGVDLDVGSSLYYWSGRTSAFRTDFRTDTVDSFWFSVDHVPVFIDFIDNHMLDMEAKYLKERKVQTFSAKAKDGTEYTFLVSGIPQELLKKLHTAPKAIQQKLLALTWVTISTGDQHTYNTTDVISQSWRPALEPSEIQEYEALLANAKKWAAVAQRDLESGRALRKMSKENMDRQRREEEQRKASPPPANPANVVPL